MNLEWKTVQLKDVLQPQGYIRGPFGSALKRGDMLENGIPVYEQQHAIYGSRQFRFYINQDKYNEMKRFTVQPNDIIISCSGTVGRVSIIKEEDPIGIISQALLLLRVNTDVIDPLYLCYFFRSYEGYNAIVSRSSGSVQVNISKRNVIEQIPLRLPDLKTQQRIVSIVSNLDNRIENNKKINDNLYAQARVITNQWFAENDRDYELLPLNEVAAINPDTYSPKTDWEYVNYLDTSSITDGYITDIQRITPSTEKLPSRARRIIASNDVVFSTVRPNQRHFGIISEPLPNMLASTGFAVIRSKNPLVCNELIYLCLTDNAFIEKMQQLAEQSTSTFPSIKPSGLGVCEIPCPKDDSSRNLTETLKTMFTLIATNHRENASLVELRDSLLQKLMSGEIDVSDIQL